ncbi:MAG: hypothetical protein OEZ06_03815 [Myxococcales bacterium]|nr:hypothetical protein [Myxococcales bacterium]
MPGRNDSSAGRVSDFGPVAGSTNPPGSTGGNGGNGSFTTGDSQTGTTNPNNLVGGLQCGGVFCPYASAPLEPCCTTSADVDSGAARTGDRCGVDYSATASDLAGYCWERDQPGVVDDRCESLLSSGGITEVGCCNERGLCGTWNATEGLGCHQRPGAEAVPCGGDDIDDAVTCEISGTYAIRADVDVTWGGRTTGLAALTDDGRGPIRIEMMARIEASGSSGALQGVVLPCNVQLPPFYSTTLCESYAPVFPEAMWDSSQMPVVPLTGFAQCDHPGCILTIDAQTVLLGINLENPEAPWPTPQQTGSLTCSAGAGEQCFPDHDDNQMPGLSITLLGGGTAPGPICPTNNVPYMFTGAPLSPNPFAIIGGARRTDHIMLGVRTKLGGASKLNPDCQTSIGAGIAEFVQSRAWGCMVQAGTFDLGGPPAGPNEPCTAAQAAFVDENLPIYHILAAGEIPNPALMGIDTSPSIGPETRMVRLGDLDFPASCAEVRSAAFPAF